MSSDRVGAALRAKAAAYQPDRMAILDRIHRGQAALEPVRNPRAGHRRTAVRTAGMAATVAAVLASSVAVTWAAMSNNVLHTSSPEPVVSPAPASRSPRTPHGPATISRPPSASPTSSPVSSQASRSPTASSSAKNSQQGFLRVRGTVDSHSIDNWAQSNVTVLTSETITGLEVSVRVVATPYLSSTGSWSTVPSEKLVATVAREGDALIYRFAVKPGVYLEKGSYTFAVQYSHAVGGRDASHDTYHAVAASSGARAEVDGGF
ncbi:hypothetical protein ACTOB_000478 [Actinoplanes oblitus]|uniref:Uncharacterized protein n=1 Tax=Actinoplanes oblitus TaxID=3040509 RepID=A0ABY8WIR4_9ACTN|nr:hypothetical protein [Actinoplanes oblitus]WIM96993.1 hypothetical protein ACTOB_000478 [Actinoplanes oblitus]